MRRRELRRAARLGGVAERQFVQSNVRLVVSIAKKYQASGLPLLDLIQEGNLGLMHAVERFDWRKGFKSSTYATSEPVGDYGQAEIGDLVEDRSAESPFEVAAAALFSAALARVLAPLDERDREILRLRFRLDRGEPRRPRPPRRVVAEKRTPRLSVTTCCGPSR